MNNLASAPRSEKKLDEAIQIYEQALKIEPKATDIRANFATALQSAGRNEDAIAEYREIVAASPNDAHAFFQLGHLLYTQGKLEEAIAALEKSLDLAARPGRNSVQSRTRVSRRGQSFRGSRDIS